MTRSGLIVILSLGCVVPVAAQPMERGALLMEHVAVLAADSLEGRQVGTEGGARARAYLQGAFARSGVASFRDGFEHPFVFSARTGGEATGVNLVGFIPGSVHPDTFIVATAHYDHLGVRRGQVYNGADDNASGVSALLALAEYLRDHPPAHSIILAALDAEEIGLRGAHALVAEPPVPREQIALNVNLDMVSRSDVGELYIAGTHHYPFLSPFLNDVAARSDIRLRFGHDAPDGSAGQDWTMSSDHAAFHAVGIPFVYFGVEDHVDYHKPTDDASQIDPAFFAAAVTTIIDAVATMDAHLAEIVAASRR